MNLESSDSRLWKAKKLPSFLEVAYSILTLIEKK